ncbi:MAG: DUF1116 domain-containing protein [Anaerolineae bacterium]|nr:DUF1116 domain-containing protein [Anaerolineae bacterium]
MSKPLFGVPLKPVNLGLATFAQSLRDQGVNVIAVDWRPPAEGYADLTHTRSGIDIDAANAEAHRRITSGRPLLVGMGIARETIPGFHARLLCHAGPPIAWEQMCGPMRGAIVGAALYEGWASTPAEAATLAASGEIDFAPCHHYHAVGPMAGIISPSMPIFVVRNETYGNLAYCTQNEGLGKVLRYGAYGPEIITRLKWMEKELYPTLARALDKTGPIDLRALIAQALHMGDEGHNRNRAGTSLLLRILSPALVEAIDDKAIVARVLRFIDSNDHFFLNLSMPAAKAMLEPAHGIPGSSVVTVMARNGTDFGLRVSGLGDRWFIAPAGEPVGLFFPGYSQADANPDIGDSAITETAGFGGFAIAGAPAIAQFVGGAPADALQATREMYEITVGEHAAFTVPILNFRGTPVGIDVRKVVETGILPRIDTGIAHKEAGIGQVGAGLLTAPMGCFTLAFAALREM